MNFEARVFEPASRQVRVLLVQAASENDARAQAAGGGATVLGLRVVRVGRAASGEVPTARRDLALVCRELRALLQAGLSVVEALEALAAAAGPASVYEALLARLREGKALSAAMDAAGGFPPLLVASVRASERTSDL